MAMFGSTNITLGQNPRPAVLGHLIKKFYGVHLHACHLKSNKQRVWNILKNNDVSNFWNNIIFVVKKHHLVSSQQKSFLKQFKGKPCLGPFCHYPCSEKLSISWEQNMIILHFYKHNNKSKTKHLFLYSVTQLSCML